MEVPLWPMFVVCYAKFDLSLDGPLKLSSHVVVDLMQMTIVFLLNRFVFMKVPLLPMFIVCFAKFDLSLDGPLKLFHMLKLT